VIRAAALLSKAVLAGLEYVQFDRYPGFSPRAKQVIDSWYPTAWSSGATAMKSGGAPSGGGFELAPAA
jgi:hypothetical protein